VSFFDPAELASVRAFYGPLAGQRTPLHHLPGLARELGISDLLVKDESRRFGLPAFKIVGARYAIEQLLARHPDVAHVAAATAGNHGRAVARVAREKGLHAHIYVPSGTSPARIAALADERAEVTVSEVPYDETVRLLAADASARGWSVVSDTAWPGYEEFPRWIMTGYTWILEEASTQWDAAPDVVIVQAGVGSLAGAAAGWLEARFGAARPKLVIAEPEGSACVGASLAAAARVTLPACAPTAMVGLRCAEVSSVAWPIIRDVADAAIGVPEPLAMLAVERLATPAADDSPILAGASGACGVAALMSLCHTPALAGLRDQLGVGRLSRVMTIVTEGRT
jgi:diaminopropionate ammonia-lyase